MIPIPMNLLCYTNKNLVNRNTLALIHSTTFLKYHHTAHHSIVTSMHKRNTVMMQLLAPCFPPIWKWLVLKIPSLKWWSSHYNSVNGDTVFPMTADQVHLHLRNTTYILHRLAEHYQKALLTYYCREVKKYKTPVYCASMASPASTQHK